MNKKIPLLTPHVPESAVGAVCDVLRSRWVGQGPMVAEFERRFSAYVGRPAVAVGSCTDALHLSYLLAGIGPGDEVIVPLFTCTATNIPLLWIGANIRFCDVAPNSLNVDMRNVLSMLTHRTKAVVIVHYGGTPVHNYHDGHQLTIPWIEDAAQALGAYDIGRANYVCYSFQAVKHITTGDGGMLTVPQRQLAEAKRRRWFGIDREAKQAGTWANDITEIGYKYQMTDIAAVMGIAGLDGLPAQVKFRRALLAEYREGLRKVPGIQLIDYDVDSAAWLCTVLATDRVGLKRKLAEHAIESDPMHYRNDRYKIFSAFRGVFPHMDEIEHSYLCLPLHMDMDIADVARVCSVIASGW